MQFVFSLTDLGWIILIAALIILAIYMINVMRHLIVTLKHANKVLEDAKVVTAIAAERAQEVDGAVGDLAEAMNIISSLVKNNQSIFAAATNAVNGFAGLKNTFSTFKGKKIKK